MFQGVLFCPFHISQGKDSVVFFLSVEEEYSPIGFISSPAAIRTLKWVGQGEELRLLVCCDDGSMMEVEAPVKGQYDTNKSYYLDPLKFTLRKFATIKDKLRVGQLGGGRGGGGIIPHCGGYLLVHMNELERRISREVQGIMHDNPSLWM